MNDPLERLIADALDAAEIGYVTDEGGGNPTNLDFRLHNGVEIEVKRFHTPRIAEQMGRAANVIAIQGEEAVRFFAALLTVAKDGSGERRFPTLADCRFAIIDTKSGGELVASFDVEGTLAPGDTITLPSFRLTDA